MEDAPAPRRPMPNGTDSPPPRAARTLRAVQQQPAAATTVAAVLAVMAVGVIDHLAPAALTLTLAYALATAATTAAAGPRHAAGVATVAVTVAATADAAAGTHAAAVAANAGTRGVLYALIVVLVHTAVRELDASDRALRTDPLTGLANRREFRHRLDTEVTRAHRHPTPLTLAVLDVDGFQEVNDIHGHAIGDHTLQTVASAIAGAIRETDVAGRVGGDEFALLLVGADPTNAERALKRVYGTALERLADQGLSVTLSVGAATFVEPPDGAVQMVRVCDDIIHNVKKTGPGSVRHEVRAPTDAPVADGSAST
jgi:diguanylate cyclase (GGDEF)-like protein